MKIQKLDKQCEHRCILGIAKMTRDWDGVSTTIFDGSELFIYDCDEITMYNFCPGCGQVLNIGSKTLDKTIRFYRAGECNVDEG